MTVIKGKDVLLYFTLNGLDQVVACFQACTLNTNANIGETSTLNSGKWKTFKGLSLEWDGSCSGLCSLDSNISVGQIRDVQFSLQSIAIKFISTDPNGLQEIFTSTCIITQVTTNGSFQNGIADYNITIKGIGEISSELPPTVPEGCVELWEFYDGTGSEGFTITVAAIAGYDIAGRIYRDGIQYRPSGANHDGTGIPGDKEFSYDITTGEIGFSTTGAPIAAGEQINIPYFVCEDTGGGEEVCVGVQVVNISLEDAIFGVPYLQTIYLTGTQPFSLAPGTVKPSWMTVAINPGDDFVTLSGIPTSTGSDIQVSFSVTNCDGANTDPFSDTFNVENNNLHFGTPVPIGVEDALNKSETAVLLQGVAGATVIVQVNLINSNGAIVQVDGGTITNGQIFNFVLDGSGEATFRVDIFGNATPGTSTIAAFHIMSVDTGTIGSPDTYVIEKDFI